MCKTTNTVENYYNPENYGSPTLLTSTTQGLSNASVIKDDWFVCTFNRMKTINGLATYYDLSKDYFVLAAYGVISPDTCKN
jgi:hypothetical protein